MNRAICISLCFTALGITSASPSLAQETPRVRTAINRSLVIHKGSSSYLGIGVAELDSERGRALNLKEVHGVEVKSVDRDSPAAKAGLKEGDVVLDYNGQRIEGTEQFMRLVRETPIDRQVKLQVWRSGGSQTLTATIGHRTEHFSFHTGDGDESDLTLEIPPMPEMPEIPEMPELARGFGSMRSGMLGIECQSLGSQLAAFFGVKQGVLARAITKDSPAEKAGMRAGDVIVKVDGQAVAGTHEIASLVRAARSKHTFPVVVVRDKKEVTLTVTVESPTRGMRPLAFTGRTC
jgi:serine protease Do